MVKNGWRKERVKNGLCAKCGEKRDREGWYCSNCLVGERERSKRNREFCKSISICPYCGKNKLYGEEKRCLECYAKWKPTWKNLSEETKIKYEKTNSKNKKIRYDKRSENGICTRCGKRKAEFGKKKCRLCLDRDALNHRNSRERNAKKIEEGR